jgi:hypothetical protein
MKTMKRYGSLNITASLILLTVLAIAISSCCSKTAQVSTYAGNGTPGETNGVGTAATFNKPTDVAVDSKGNLYVADHENDLVREISPSQAVTLFFDWGARPSGGPIKITRLDASSKGEVFVLDHENLSIRKVSEGSSTTVTGARRDDEYYDHYVSVDGSPDSASFYMLKDLTLDAKQKNIKVIDNIVPYYVVRNITWPGRITSTPNYDYTAVGSYGPVTAITTDALNIFLAAGNLIIKIEPSGVATLYAGNATPGYVDGPRLNARFNNITAIDADGDGNIFVSDNGNHRIRMIKKNGTVITLAGNGTAGFADGPGATAQFNNPQGLVVYKCKLYVADQDNHRIRKITVPR